MHTILSVVMSHLNPGLLFSREKKLMKFLALMTLEEKKHVSFKCLFSKLGLVSCKSFHELHFDDNLPILFKRILCAVCTQLRPDVVLDSFGLSDIYPEDAENLHISFM